MKKTNSIRKIDNLGRIVIPMDIRKALEIKEWDELRIYLDDNTIKIEKALPSCTFCGSEEGLVDFEGKSVCAHCLSRLRQQ